MKKTKGNGGGKASYTKYILLKCKGQFFTPFSFFFSFSAPFFSTPFLLGSGPEGADDLCFHTGEISPSPSPPSPTSPPRGSNTSFEAQIPALRLKSQPWSSNPSLEALIPALWLKPQPWDSNPSLETQIPALRLKSQPQSSNPNLEAQIPTLRLKS